jgi:hypothetical protein
MRRRLHYAWIIALVTFVVLLVTAGIRATPGVLMIYGWIGASHQLGASAAAFGAGAIRTMLGNYQAAFWIAGVLCVLAGVSFLTIGRRTFRPVPVAALTPA